MDKMRSEGRCDGRDFRRRRRGPRRVILDDLIGGGGTIARTAAACRAHGAARVCAAATHGVFTGKTPEILSAASLDAIVLTDSVPLSEAAKDALGNRLTILSLAGLFAEAIRRRHENGSITDLLANGP